MSPELEYYIDTYLINELKTPVIESFNNYEALSVPDYEAEFMAILMNEGNVERTQLVSDFNAKVLSLNKELLISHGITLTNTVDIEFTSKVLNALINIASFTDPMIILNEIDHPVSPEEKLSEILSHFTDLSPTNIVIDIEAVEPSLISRIKETLESKITYTEVDIELRRNIYKKLKSIRTFLSSDELLAFTLIREENIIVGLEFSNYTKYASRHLEDEEILLSAKEVFALLAMSSDGYANALVTYRNNSSAIFVELDHITKVDIALIKLINEYETYLITNLIVKEIPNE